MQFYIILIVSVLFAQYASEMRKVPETLNARKETWAYQVLEGLRYVFNQIKTYLGREKDDTSIDETTGEDNENN